MNNKLMMVKEMRVDMTLKIVLKDNKASLTEVAM